MKTFKLNDNSLKRIRNFWLVRMAVVEILLAGNVLWFLLVGLDLYWCFVPVAVITLILAFIVSAERITERYLKAARAITIEVNDESLLIRQPPSPSIQVLRSEVTSIVDMHQLLCLGTSISENGIAVPLGLADNGDVELKAILGSWIKIEPISRRAQTSRIFVPLITNLALIVPFIVLNSLFVFAVGLVHLVLFTYVSYKLFRTKTADPKMRRNTPLGSLIIVGLIFIRGYVLLSLGY